MFCTVKPDSVVGNHVSGIDVSVYLERLFASADWRTATRSCMQVGFLPLHLSCFHKS